MESFSIYNTNISRGLALSVNSNIAAGLALATCIRENRWIFRMNANYGISAHHDLGANNPRMHARNPSLNTCLAKSR